MENYLLYVLIAGSTIASPGPGVVLTLTNSIRHGFANAIPGITGVSLGMFLISVVAAAGLGVIMAGSPWAFSLMKYLGAAYLIYLGVKLWRAKAFDTEFTAENNPGAKSTGSKFLEGLGITVLNPKPIVFFMALFPQFFNKEQEYLPQFLLLALTFCFLIFIIHFLYAGFAHVIKNRTANKNYFQIINRLGASFYLGFACMLLFSKF